MQNLNIFLGSEKGDNCIKIPANIMQLFDAALGGADGLGVQSFMEHFNLFNLVYNLNIPGSMAEVGVYQGGSACLMAEARRGKRQFVLCDTFEGLPEIKEKDDPKKFYPGMYTSSEESVGARLKKYPDINIYKGFAPDCFDGFVKSLDYAFVHLDVDLYEGTYKNLEFFWPKMVLGGLILVHDYPGSKGVTCAVDEFYRRHAAWDGTLISLLGRAGQALFVKIKPKI